MSRHCFTYGSLMCEDIMSAVAVARCAHQPAILKGYRRAPVIGEHYPGIVAATDSEVAGVLYLELPESAWPRLDAFEGSRYARQQVRVRLEDGRREMAWAYVFRAEHAHRLAAGEWDFERFKRTGKARFERLYLGFDKLAPGRQS